MSTDIIEQLKWRYATKKFNDSKILSEEKLNILKESFIPIELYASVLDD